MNVRSRLKLGALTLAGILAFVTIGILLEEAFGIRFDTTYRLACAAVCLFLISRIGSDFPGQQWPRVGLVLAFLVNGGLFFTPLLSGRASRGEISVFALPDAIVLMVARIVSCAVSDRPVDDHERAVRQQLILGLVLAVLACALLFAVLLMAPRLPPR